MVVKMAMVFLKASRSRVTRSSSCLRDAISRLRDRHESAPGTFPPKLLPSSRTQRAMMPRPVPSVLSTSAALCPSSRTCRTALSLNTRVYRRRFRMLSSMAFHPFLVSGSGFGSLTPSSEVAEAAPMNATNGDLVKKVVPLRLESRKRSREWGGSHKRSLEIENVAGGRGQILDAGYKILDAG